MVGTDQTLESGVSRSTPYGLWFLCGTLAGGIFSIDMAIPLGVAVPVLYVGVVWQAFWSGRTRFVLNVAVISTLLTIGAVFLKPDAGELWKVLANRFLAVFAIWLTTLLGLQRKAVEEQRGQAVRDREKALEEIKMLRGFLPICASCKKIRDDAGRWIQMEAYIRDHSQAEFSHGICPQCAEKLYPEFSKGGG